MRYSMLVYLVNMLKTLLQAAQYLQMSPESELRGELLVNGRQMLAQIQKVLRDNQSSLKSFGLMERLRSLEALWEHVGRDTALEQELEQLIQIFPQEVDYKVRAVFYAEQGQKWDSMESVYAFMRENPRFDPVVVLTPVFRVIQQDGKQKHEIIYDDYLTPLGIPFFEQNQYNRKEDCPDLAFMSQPYENCTLPEFWAENIAKDTRLVYLQYFLPSGGTPAKVDRYCRMPVFKAAWRVAGISEKHMEYYHKYAHDGGANMLLTGLPKLDHIVNLKDHTPPLPKGWEKLQGKKVFLWNTWYSIPASSLRHFEAIVKWFDAHPDCALIWRSHPMSDTVTKLYHPELYPVWQLYHRIIDQMPNAVVDREVSYDAAFYYSDAMISDSSSMTSQYLFMDKPLLLLLNEVRNGKALTPEEMASIVVFVSGEWKESAYEEEEIFAFFERTRRGEDRNAGLRRMIRERDLPLADGVCGERVCNMLWKELHQEDGIMIESGRDNSEGAK